MTMRIAIALALLVLVVTASGCGRATPTLAGGKPVSHWVEALQSPDAATRRQAVAKLGNVGPADPAAFPALLGALRDRDAAVRREAILAVMKSGPQAEDAVPVLAEVQLKDKDAHVRADAGRALAAIRQTK
jgi:HEAT repeat protein